MTKADTDKEMIAHSHRLAYSYMSFLASFAEL